MLWSNTGSSQTHRLTHSIEVVVVQCCGPIQDRPSGGVTRMKLPFAKDHAPIDQLVDVVTTIKPTAIIGL